MQKKNCIRKSKIRPADGLYYTTPNAQLLLCFLLHERCDLAEVHGEDEGGVGLDALELTGGISL